MRPLPATPLKLEVQEVAVVPPAPQAAAGIREPLLGQARVVVDGRRTHPVQLALVPAAPCADPEPEAVSHFVGLAVCDYARRAAAVNTAAAMVRAAENTVARAAAVNTAAAPVQVAVVSTPVSRALAAAVNTAVSRALAAAVNIAEGSVLAAAVNIAEGSVLAAAVNTAAAADLVLEMEFG